MDLLIASHNHAKIATFQELFRELPARVRALVEFPDVPDFPEHEATFEANALAKARDACARTGLPTIADDGGLEIDALDGWPGVHSRRIFSSRGGFSQDGTDASGGGDDRRATDEEMIAEVLRRLEGMPNGERGCQMRTVVAFAAPDGTATAEEGIDRGHIAIVASSKRIHGFPFRSIFFHDQRGGIVVDINDDPAADIMTHRHEAVGKLMPTLRHWMAVHSERNRYG